MRLSPLVFLLGGMLSGSLQASEAREWLGRMIQAGVQQSFSGTYIYERSGNFSTYGIWHLVQPAGSSNERLLQLDGQQQEVLLVDGQVRCATKDMAQHFAGAQPLDGGKFDVARLEQTYEFKVLGPSRVAGRPAVALLLLPKDANRYARELHLDSETGLLLKSLLLNSQGQLLERLQFTRLIPNADFPEQDLQPATDCIAPAGATASASQVLDWQVGWMPAGFVLSNTLERQAATPGSSVQSLTFDDGLARFSVFLEALDEVVVGNAHAQLGPTVVVSRPLNTTRGEFMVTVVGEIPLATAEQVVLSVTDKELAGVQQ